MSEPVFIEFWQLLLAMGFIVVAGATSVWQKLHLEKDLAIGTLRTFCQLFIMGYALKYIFALNTPYLVVALFSFMCWFAARIIRKRVSEDRIPIFVPTLVASFCSFFVVSVIVTGVIVQADPWWAPRYFLPMGGMIIGNSMNAISVALDRLMSELTARRDEVEMKLSLGATAAEASHETLVNALKAGMIPSINSMMGVGMVFIPGMMTGQILAGADPINAVRYQIVVMLMIVGATALGSLLVTHLVRNRCFGTFQQLLLQPRIKE